MVCANFHEKAGLITCAKLVWAQNRYIHHREGRQHHPFFKKTSKEENLTAQADKCLMLFLVMVN